MKRMCLSMTSFLALLVCLAAVGGTTQAQTRDKYLISAKAGGINFVSGNVTVERKGSGIEQSLRDQDNLEDGDVVRTGMGGRVEVLLNPGSYMRIAENSEFEMSETSLEHLRIKLRRGSAIIEVVGTDDTQLSLQVDTPQTYALLVKRGIYRINVLQTGVTEVMVRNGRALVGQMAQVIKGGKMIVVSRSSMSEVAKIEKRPKDSLELWSRDRAEYLASINRRLPSRSVYAAMDIFNADWSSSYRGYNRGRYPDGVWVREGNCYVFVPYGGRGSSSPYGFSYPSGYRNCCNNGPRNNPPVTGGGNNGGNGDNNGGGTANNNPPPETEPGRTGNAPEPSQPRPEPSQPRPEPSQPRPEPATFTPAPSYSPPPSPPPAPAPARMDAPAMRESSNPN